MTKRSWEVLHSVYPAIVQSRHSEKLSIIKLLDNIMNQISKNLETFALEIKVNLTLSTLSGLFHPLFLSSVGVKGLLLLSIIKLLDSIMNQIFGNICIGN